MQLGQQMAANPDAIRPARVRQHWLSYLVERERGQGRPELLLAAGDTARGERALSDGLAWVQATLRDHVPPEFRDSFRYRNPTNSARLNLAARQGIGA